MGAIRKTILVVEDDLDIVTVVEETLADAGYEVHVALTAADAISLLNGGLRPDLIFSDVLMPGKLTGVALVDKALEICPTAKVLMTSGFSAPFDFVRKPDVIRHAFLRKPYRMNELIEQVDGLLG